METDHAVGQLLDWLDQSGLRKNTLVVYTSDHGDMRASHGGREGKTCFYNEAELTPLIFSLPGVIPQGKLIDQPVSTIDMAPTILDILGSSKKEVRMAASAMQGSSLTGVIAGTEIRNFSVAQWSSKTPAVPHWMVKTAQYKLMVSAIPNAKEVDGFYDLNADPSEVNNLLGASPQRPQYLPMAKQLKQTLVQWLKRINSPDLQGVMNRLLK
jgi:arylsulfatase A-like enzyme